MDIFGGNAGFGGNVGQIFFLRVYMHHATTIGEQEGARLRAPFPKPSFRSGGIGLKV